MPQIAIAAGEPSGDRLGADLIRRIRAIRPDVGFAGIAGPAMRDAGCEAVFRVEDLSVMGLVEVLRHLPRLARIRRALVARLLRDRPAAFVGVDAPDFNLGVEKKLRAQRVPTLQYVCPSVWAWRAGRVETLREACDEVLCVLPFEQPFLAAAAVTATFVGHPLADEISEVDEPGPARRTLGISGSPVIALLPGSRASEIHHLGPTLAAAARVLASRLPGAAFVAPMASPAIAAQFGAVAQRSAGGCPIRLFDGQARTVIAASDIAIAASGTVTLEAMLIGRPMVVAYRVTAATYAIAKTLGLLKVSSVSLPNLLAGERLVPEFLQGRATPDALAAAALAILQSPNQISDLRQRFRALRATLGRNASDIAARAVLRRAGLYL
jgi:lipid-A-disaccharide synthase